MCSTCTATRASAISEADGVPADLVAASRQAWDTTIEAGPSVRSAQQPGRGHRPDGHDRPGDGLRHHRHRARPVARQDEEARRRRHDVDRQPDDPACAAASRLFTRRRSTRSSPTSTSTCRSSARRTSLREHVPVFACSMGDNTIHYEGHVRMMAAVQPVVSGGDFARPSTCPSTSRSTRSPTCTGCSWELGLKSVAIYRDNSKVGQPLSTSKPIVTDVTEAVEIGPDGIVERIIERVVHQPVRQKLPRTRRGRTFEFRVADCKGFATIGEYDNGQPGEIFLTVSKQGSTMAGVMDAFAKSVSYGLQYGVPMRAFVEAFTNMRFEPAGMTDDPDLRFASLDHGLPVPPAGARVHDLRRAGRTRDLLGQRTTAAHAAGSRGGDHRDQPGFRAASRSEVGALGGRAVDADAARPHRPHTRRQHGRPGHRPAERRARCACSAAW